MEISPQAHMGLVTLSVSDMDRSLAYWQDAVGLRVLSRENGTAELGADTPLVRFVEEPGAQSAQGYTGLFHVALLVPDRLNLGRFFGHVAREQIVPTGLSDHVVSEAIYLRDPDYHGIEVYADRPREQWEGRVREKMTTIPLDTDSLLAEAGDSAFDGLPDGTTVGHIHLCVSDVGETVGFYHDKLGMGLIGCGEQAAFLSAGGYHHHIGANTWESAGAAPPPTGSAALRHATLILPDANERDRILGRIRTDAVTETVDGPLVVDPAGNALLLSDQDSGVPPSGRA